MEYSLSNAQFVLLGLIGEQPDINGYAIRRLVEERGFTAWAGVASSSIYNGLKRIEERGFAVSATDSTKRHRGPKGQGFRLTDDGRHALNQAIREGLASTREHDPKLNIALSAVEQLGLAEAAEALQQRSGFLALEFDRVSAARREATEAPIAADLLFDRILHAIEAEQDWTVNAAERLRSAAADAEVAAS